MAGIVSCNITTECSRRKGGVSRIVQPQTHLDHHYNAAHMIVVSGFSFALVVEELVAIS